MGGWPEEVFYSVFRVAICKLLLNKPWPEAQDTFLQAYNLKPDRAEPLYQLAKIQRMNGNPNLGYMFAKMACEIPYPKDDILFISDQVYSWMVLDEFASTAYYAGDYYNGYKAAKILCQKLDAGEIPEEHRTRIFDNISFYENAIKEGEKKKEVNMAKLEEAAKSKRDKMLAKKKTQQKNKKRKKQKART